MNTDFGGKINLIQKHNSKNSVIWSSSKKSIPVPLQTVGQQKFSPGVILFGGISSSDLIPSAAPIFVDAWLQFACKKVNKKRKSMDRFLYIELIEHQFKPHIDQLYGDITVIWQDDADRKHRFRYALDKINEPFSECIDPEEQASKMADIWPIENVWVISKKN